MKIHSEKPRKNLLKLDHPLILNSYNDELRIHTNPDHAMIPSINNDISTPNRTPEDRAKSPGYLKDRDQTWKV